MDCVASNFSFTAYWVTFGLSLDLFLIYKIGIVMVPTSQNQMS